MTPIAIIALVVYVALVAFVVLMWLRLAFDLARQFVRGWRPTGPLLVLAEAAYLVTDPPVKTVRRVLPPLRLGGIALDLSWTIVMLVALIVLAIVGRFT